jgi:hypothetical protein
MPASAEPDVPVALADELRLECFVAFGSGTMTPVSSTRCPAWSCRSEPRSAYDDAVPDVPTVALDDALFAEEAAGPRAVLELAAVEDGDADAVEALVPLLGVAFERM